MGVAERVHPLVAPILADLGLELYDLEHGGGTLRVVIDREGGVDLDELALATRLISRQLDHSDPIPGRYTLEVTSPGLERTLRTAEHYRLAVGSTVSVRTLPHVEGDRRVHGVLVAADGDRITVRLDDGPALGSERTLAVADVERARTVFEWGPGPKPGKGPGTSKRAAARRTNPDLPVSEEEGAPKP